MNFKPWGGVTSPNLHNPELFRYLIHVDSGFNDPEVTSKRFFTDNISSINNPFRLSAQRGHWNDKPEQPLYISASLIDTQHRKLFVGGRHGLIIEAPREGILATSPTDILTAGVKIHDKALILEPNELLEATAEERYNEVVIRPELIVVRAIAYLNSAIYSHHLEGPSLEELEGVSRSLSLPLIML